MTAKSKNRRNCREEKGSSERAKWGNYLYLEMDTKGPAYIEDM